MVMKTEKVAKVVRVVRRGRLVRRVELVEGAVDQSTSPLQSTLYLY